MTNYSQALIDALQDWPHWPVLAKYTASDCEFTPLEKGLSNENWLVTLPHKNIKHQQRQYVIRINAINAHSLNINRQAEWQIQGLLSKANILTPYLYRHKKDLYWIRPYVAGKTLADTLVENGHDFLNDSTLQLFSQYLHAIHNTDTPSLFPTIDFKDRTEHYWQQINQQNLHERALKDIKKSLDQALNQHTYQAKLCHMDTNTHNWIIKQNSIELIDWEYAAIGNPAWDLAVLTESANLTQTQTQTLLNFYQDISASQLQYARQQMHYLSSLWFAVQQKTPIEELMAELKAILLNISS